MTFLNKKEQVLEIQLTQHGKALMARGLFKPDQYAFFDDDIIYDSTYIAVEETQNDSQPRIKEAIRTNAQYNFRGLDTDKLDPTGQILVRREISEDESTYSFELLDQPDASLRDNFYPVSSPLGTIASSGRELPSWEVKVLQEEITGSIKYDMVSGAKIPQINIEPKWETRYSFLTRGGSEILNFDQVLIENSEISNGNMTAFIRADKKHIVLEFKEKNIRNFKRSNFEIEVFKVLTEEESSEGDITLDKPPKLKRLRFEQNSNSRTNLIVNNILYEQNEIGLSGEIIENQRAPNTNLIDDEFDVLENDQGLTGFEDDPNHVEYFFDIQYDENIDNQILCRTLARNNFSQDILADLNIQCEDIIENFQRPNIYRVEDYDDPCA